jgi:hypothetical protein
VKVQKPNIKGLISFGKKRSEKKRMKEKRRKKYQLIVNKLEKGIVM